MIDPKELRKTIGKILARMGMNSPAAVNLLLGTAAHESHLGRWTRQMGGGPARGIYQMEPDTEKDIWENYLKFRPHLVTILTAVTGVTGPDPEQLEHNLTYATAMARLHYWRENEPLPAYNDIPALAKYWDDHYNKNPNKGHVWEFIQNYTRLVGNS